MKLNFYEPKYNNYNLHFLLTERLGLHHNTLLETLISNIYNSNYVHCLAKSMAACGHVKQAHRRAWPFQASP